MGKLYNLEYLEEISSGDSGFIIDMLNDFVKNTPDILSEIDKHINAADWEQLYKSVHKFIPTFEFVGAEKIRNELRNLEQISKSQTNLESIDPLLKNIKSFCNNIILEIKSDFNI
jgi:HPt (histidine-containing phosphotransfer) domain-containing protein